MLQILFLVPKNYRPTNKSNKSCIYDRYNSIPIIQLKECLYRNILKGSIFVILVYLIA